MYSHSNHVHSIMSSPVISNMDALSLVAPRGGPVQQGVPGLFTCAQSICGSAYSCSPTGVQLQCVNAMKEGYDMSYRGTTMQCDGMPEPPTTQHDQRPMS